MLHPAGLRKNLCMLLLIYTYDLSIMIKDDETTACCALVNSAYVFLPHFSLSIQQKLFVLIQSQIILAQKQ